MSPPQALLDSIRAQGFSDVKPVVSLDAFFTGNDDPASIGCNLTEHPGVNTFFSTLREIRARADVQDVLVAITEDMGDDEWPFSDTVYVLTTAAPPGHRVVTLFRDRVSTSATCAHQTGQ